MNFPDKPSLPSVPKIGEPEKNISLPLPPKLNEEGEPTEVPNILPPKPAVQEGISLPGAPELETETNDVLIHPETGEKFDLATGEPIVEVQVQEVEASDVTQSVETEEEEEGETFAILEEEENSLEVSLPDNDDVDISGLEDAMVEENSVNSSAGSNHEANVEDDSSVVHGEKERASRWSAGGRPSENKTKIPETITAREWDDNTDDDPIYGLGAEKEKKEYKTQTSKKIILNERDYIMMAFMAKHKYCYSDQLARLVKAENKDVRARLAKLEKEGYIRREIITRGQDLWLPKKAGLQMIGSPYAPIQKGQIPPSAIQHTIGVGNIAVELEMGEGAENILGEQDSPKMNRYQYGKYDPSVYPSEYGEMTISEKEIRSSNRVLRGGNKITTLDLQQKVKAAAYDTTAPERLEGNEWMFVVYSKGEHFPDLVVSRPRDEKGKPQHLAIELELTAKDLPSWRRILKWYRDDGIMFDKVYYFTHSRTIATRIQKVVDELDLTDFVILRKYIPKNDRGPFWG